MRPKSCLSNNSKTTEANLTKLHRKIEHNEKVCQAQELGSYAQGQGHNWVRGQIVPKIVLLINYWSKFDKTSVHEKIKHNKKKVPTPKVKVVMRSKVKIVSQQ